MVPKYLKLAYKKEGFILTHGFRGFIPWSFGSITFGPLLRQKHHGKSE
jgi:hypothetical protein